MAFDCSWNIKTFTWDGADSQQRDTLQAGPGAHSAFYPAITRGLFNQN